MTRGSSRNSAMTNGLTAAGRERLRQAILVNQPWRYSTGPRTPEGKVRSALNGKLRQRGPRSVREVRRDVADLHVWLDEMEACRREALGQ